ncbi:MAG: NAD-dependent epimerase/dehydratase family protein [Marinoscillum sp.]
MRVLITGATGFLGSKVVEGFARSPDFDQIVATGRILVSERRVLADHVTYRLGELSDAAFVGRLFSDPIDLVINCASLSSPWGSYAEFYQANIVSQKLLIKESVKARVKRFIYISSPSIYFKFKDQFDVTEDTPLPSRKVNHYAKTKFEAEQLLDESGLNYITLRPRALVGAGDTVIMPRLIRSYEKGKLKIMGSGENLVDLTPVSNMVDAILLASLADENACGQAYNISNGQSIKLWEAINQILSKVGYKPIEKKMPYWLMMTVAWFMEISAKYLNGNEEPALTRYSVGVLAHSFTLNIDKARQNLNYAPRQTIEAAMQEFVDWYKLYNNA